MGVVEAVVEPVFPEADEYPSYRELSKPIQLPRIEVRAAVKMERYVRDALRATQTEMVAR